MKQAFQLKAFSRRLALGATALRGLCKVPLIIWALISLLVLPNVTMANTVPSAALAQHGPATAKPEVKYAKLLLHNGEELIINSAMWTYSKSESFGETMKDVYESEQRYKALARKQRGGAINFTKQVDSRSHKGGTLEQRLKLTEFKVDHDTFGGMNDGEYGYVEEGSLVLGDLKGKHTFYWLNPVTCLPERKILTVGEAKRFYICYNKMCGRVSATVYTDLPGMVCKIFVPLKDECITEYEMCETYEITEVVETQAPAQQQWQQQNQTQIMMGGRQTLVQSNSTQYLRYNPSIPYFFPGGGNVIYPGGGTPIGPIYCPPLPGGRPGVNIPGYRPGTLPDNPFGGPIPGVNYGGNGTVRPPGAGQKQANG